MMYGERQRRASPNKYIPNSAAGRLAALLCLCILSCKEVFLMTQENKARLDELMQILKEEYGIETPEKLREAVKKLGGIDITPLAARLPDEHREHTR